MSVELLSALSQREVPVIDGTSWDLSNPSNATLGGLLIAGEVVNVDNFFGIGEDVTIFGGQNLAGITVEHPWITENINSSSDGYRQIRGMTSGDYRITVKSINNITFARLTNGAFGTSSVFPWVTEFTGSQFDLIASSGASGNGLFSWRLEKI